jgi:hypothetical protein
VTPTQRFRYAPVGPETDYAGGGLA